MTKDSPNARLLIVIDGLAVLSVISIVFYAFTGLHFWAPVEQFDMTRGMALVFLHIAPIFVAVIRRIVP